MERAAQRYTQLTAWFLLNEADPNARQLLYSDIAYHYVFDKTTTLWKPRQRGATNIIPRMYSVSPRDDERFYLRLLLLHVKGARSFEDLRSIDGTMYNTFREAADARNLIANDTEWQRCLAEAVTSEMPSELRQLYALICIFNRPKHPYNLYQEFEESLIEDYLLTNDRETAVQKALVDIERIFADHGCHCHDFNLPTPIVFENFDENNNVCQDQFSREAEANRLETLTDLQRAAFDEIISAVNNPNRELSFFFLDGPGGSGKTYLYNTLIAYLGSQDKEVSSFATTGIAADLLKGGRTVHSGFKLPVPILETSTSRMTVPSENSLMLQRSQLIIIDEASMLSKKALEMIDELLKHIMDSLKPFGNKVILLGGDFRQTAPVVPRGSNAAIVETCIKQSTLWTQVHKLSLSQNMRITGQNDFNKWLLQVGDGTPTNAENLGDDAIEIPDDMVCREDIVKQIFGESLHLNSEENIERAASKLILTPLNKETLNLNNQIINLIAAETITYKSIDNTSSEDLESAVNYPEEFLNSLTPSGVPPHDLRLKVGTIIMLIRNLDPRRGL